MLHGFQRKQLAARVPALVLVTLPFRIAVFAAMTTRGQASAKRAATIAIRNVKPSAKIERE
jgi:hypothetical protein